MAYIIREDELMHYGRKGMKWGQHIFGEEARAKRREARVKRREERDERTLQRRRTRAERQVTRRGLREIRDVEREYTNRMRDNRISGSFWLHRGRMTQKEFADRARAYQKRRDEIKDLAQREVNHVSKMTLADFRAEDRGVWANRAQVALHNVAIAPIRVLTLGRVGRHQYFNTDYWRTQWRLGSTDSRVSGHEGRVIRRRRARQQQQGG